MDAPVALAMPLVQVSGVRHCYQGGGGGNEVLVLDDVDLTLKKDEIVALLGRSGSGKSTLLRIIGQVGIEVRLLAIQPGHGIAEPAHELCEARRSADEPQQEIRRHIIAELDDGGTDYVSSERHAVHRDRRGLRRGCGHYRLAARSRVGRVSLRERGTHHCPESRRRATAPAGAAHRTGAP